MVAAGYGAADRVAKAGDSMSGTLTFTSAASPPITLASGTSGYVLTSDGSGNITLAPNPGSSGGVTLTPTAVKTVSNSPYTTAAGEFVVVDTTSGNVTVTLPTGPADKSIVGVKMITTASSHTVTVACGGSDVLNKTGGSTSLTLSLTGQGAILQYKSSGAIWYVTGDDLPLGQLDARYTQLAGDLGNTTASPTVAKIQGTTIATPPGGTTDYLRADGNWAVPAGGSGASLDSNAAHILALGAQAAGANGLAADSGHVHPTTGVALLAGAAFTGAVSTTGNLSASGTFGVTGNATASGTLAVTKAITGGVVALTDNPTIAVNASLGNHFRVTLGGNRTLGTPTWTGSPVDGQKITFEIIQDLTGSRTLAYSGAYAFGATVPSPTLTTTASKRDFLGFIFNSTASAWYCLAVSLGY